MTDPVRLSKRLSLVLRHRPESVGVTLDRAGWVDVDTLLAALRVRRADLDEVVAGSDKQRFELAGGRIRARQGHTVPVDLGLPVVGPPDRLFHGTHSAVLPAILRDGLHRMGRHHVHLSADWATAERVGGRRGRPVVLAVDSARMAADGHEFRVSANGVWLTGHVPPGYLTQNDPGIGASLGHPAGAV